MKYPHLSMDAVNARRAQCGYSLWLVFLSLLSSWDVSTESTITSCIMQLALFASLKMPIKRFLQYFINLPSKFCASLPIIKQIFFGFNTRLWDLVGISGLNVVSNILFQSYVNMMVSSIEVADEQIAQKFALYLSLYNCKPMYIFPNSTHEWNT